MSIFSRLFKKQELPFVPPTPPNHTEIIKPKLQREPLPVNFHLKALVIADTHGHLSIDENLNLLKEPVDVCLLLGDVSYQELQYIKDTVKAPIYGVLGNHNEFGDYEKCGIENIHGRVIEINGVRIAGIQGSIRYKKSDLPLYTDEESIEIADSMEPADILISHDSPKYLYGTHNFAHSGLPGITHYCEKHSVPLNIHGHHHKSKEHILDNGTKSICVCGVKLIEI